jgi:ComF family protein
MWKSVLNLFLKPNCPLCDRVAEDVLCRYCDRQLRSDRISQPDRYWQSELPLFPWGKYEGLVKQSIARLKYDGHQELGFFLGELLAISWQEFLPSNLPKKLVIIPIPLHAEKLKTRGFNQAELIARRFGKINGYKLDRSLQRTRSTQAQFGLSKLDRVSNVADAFSLPANSRLQPGTQVLLVDDIYTTGATVRSAVSTLQSKGVKVCGTIVVATGKNPKSSSRQESS